jgi:hypothetical protein
MPAPDDPAWFDGLALTSRPMDLGAGPWRRLMAAYVRGGGFEGERLRGEVLPGGGDWPMLSNEATPAQAVNTRVVWRTHDGAYLYLAYGGRIVVPAEARLRIAEAGAANVPASSYYFRALPTFETADPRYAWLNRIVCVAVGRLTATGVAYAVYEVL